MKELKLLFICLGNICRSPAAEAIMSAKLVKAGLDQRIKCDSAGIIGFHAGSLPDARMRSNGKKKGYLINSISRQVNPKTDFDEFDMIIGMDDENIHDLEALTRNASDRKKIFRMTDFSRNYNYQDVPDPYYGGDDGFMLVIDLIEDGCDGLLDHLIKSDKII